MYKVMIVDDNMTNLIMAKKALEDIYEIVPVSSGETALEYLNDMPEPPDLILLDVEMPKVNGFQVISEIKCSEKLNKIPVIFLTAQDDDTTEVEGFFLGAMDYIKKPYTAALLRKRVDVHIQLLEQNRKLEDYNKNLCKTVQDKVHSLAELEFGIIETFVDILRRKDVSCGSHAKRVERYMNIFLPAVIRSGKYKISADDGEIIIYASKIHDIGKLCIPDYCLNKMTELNYNELLEMQMHSLHGADIIKNISSAISQNILLNYAYNMCRSHHERWDGKGYPDKLAGTRIPLEARMLSIVNSYDEFRVRNFGRKMLLGHDDAMNRVALWSRTYFDPDLVTIFMSVGEEIRNVAL